MKLASLKSGRDGKLVVVSRDLKKMTEAVAVAPTLQAALDEWRQTAPHLEKLYDEKKILDHGLEVGKKLAYVLSGGRTNLNNELSEDDLYNLELDAFMKLIQTDKTHERIKHTLETGKPLIN